MAARIDALQQNQRESRAGGTGGDGRKGDGREEEVAGGKTPRVAPRGFDGEAAAADDPFHPVAMVPGAGANRPGGAARGGVRRGGSRAGAEAGRGVCARRGEGDLYAATVEAHGRFRQSANQETRAAGTVRSAGPRFSPSARGGGGDRAGEPVAPNDRGRRSPRSGGEAAGRDER